MHWTIGHEHNEVNNQADDQKNYPEFSPFCLNVFINISEIEVAEDNDRNSND